MGEWVTLPFGLLVGYGAIVLTAGATIGAIVTREFRKWSPPEIASQDDIELRFSALEEELDLARGEIDHLVEERDFLKQLYSETSKKSAGP